MSGRWPGVLFLASALAALACAYVSQMVFGLIPCKLCIYERIPYFAVIVPALINIVKRDKYSFFVSIACYVSGVVISLYHVSLEHGWIEDFLHCADNISNAATLSDIKASLLSNNVPVSCKVPGFVFLGLSMSGWNIVYSIFCMIAAFLVRKRGY
ncbi:disulfide bond formation protein B [Anaplasma bovis]|uniref:disulfide bond formation protein B n=1 Tax=Anaplasma bovis TaxID=186733 RepID=UPI002FF09A91